MSDRLKLAVLESFEAMQQAMIDKDVDTMRALTTEDKTFTHMSGKVQTREEFFGEIADGTLNYFGYEVHDPHVTVVGDRATLTCSTTLDARVYGMSGSWTLPTNAHFVRIGGNWIQCDARGAGEEPGPVHPRGLGLYRRVFALG